MKKPVFVLIALALAGPLFAQGRAVAPVQKLRLALPGPALDLINARTVALMQLSGKPMIETSEPPEPYITPISHIQGVPGHVRLLSAQESAQTTYRHYSSPETIAAILKGGNLRSGETPYVQAAAHRAWKIYNDLSGIFLTLPGVAAEDVGVSKKKSAYIDLRLPAGTPVLEIEPGKILLVPAPAPGLELPVEITAHRKTNK